MEINYVAIDNASGEIMGASELSTIYHAVRHHIRMDLHYHDFPGDWHFFRGNFNAVYNPELEINRLHMGARFFEEGKYYIYPELNGGSYRVQVIKRDETSITIANPRNPAYIELWPITYDELGNERAKVWEYKGYEGYLSADQS